jgi:hypothetical protein
MKCMGGPAVSSAKAVAWSLRREALCTAGPSLGILGLSRRHPLAASGGIQGDSAAATFDCVGTYPAHGVQRNTEAYPICGAFSEMEQETTISERQPLALDRVLSSMNLVGARISVAADDQLSPTEMAELGWRLYEPIRSVADRGG